MNYKDSYDGVINALKTIIGNANKQGHILVRIEDIENAIPELKENNNETILEKLIEGFKYHQMFNTEFGDLYCSDIINWLEKQKSVEQNNTPDSQHKSALEAWKEMRLEVYAQASGNRHKPNVSDDSTKMFSLNDIDEIIENIEDEIKKPKYSTFNIIPKFKVGDWIINNQGSAFQIAYIDTENSRYVFEIGGYTKEEMNYESIAFANNHYRKWTIDDAKDGDVLAGSKNDVILMFRGIGNTEWDDVIDYHCYYDCYRKDFIVQEDVKYWGNIENNQLKPATKEQRDLLFSKMKEAGYEWNAEKKELKKIVAPQPKFKVGDWIVDNCNNVWQVVEVSNNFYRLKNINESESLPKIKWVNETFHLWSVKDAKDGDVIAFSNDTIVMFKNLYNSTTFHSYCHIEDGIFNISKDDMPDWWEGKGFYPATKEQREILMKAMTDAGYQWDAEKKELKKIEDEIEIPFGAKDSELQEVTYYIPKGFHAEIDDDKVVIKKGKKTAEWSENDEEILKNLIDYFSLDDGLRLPTEETIDWLKSLKQRIDG